MTEVPRRELRLRYRYRDPPVSAGPPPVVRPLLGAALGGLVGFTVTVLVVLSLTSLPVPAGDFRPRGAHGSTSPTVFFWRDGSELARLPPVSWRVPPTGQVPKVVAEVIRFAEDRRFTEHTGWDLHGIVRAAWSNLRAGRVNQGGSTISQQLARTLDPHPKDPRWVRKVRELAQARHVERWFTKPELFEAYLHTVYFGRLAYGLEAASWRFFGVPASRLGPHEAVALAVQLPAPSLRDPADTIDLQVELREELIRDGVVSRAQFRAAPRLPLVPWPQPDTSESGWPVRSALWELAQLGFDRDRLRAGGYRVELTLDRDTQQRLERVVRQRFANRADDVDAAMVSLDQHTGEVLGVVGGARDRPLNLATGAGGSGRQPGSAYKPLVMLAALQRGVSPTRRWPAPATYRLGNHVVRNADRRSYGSLTMSQALVHSVNTVFVQLAEAAGPQAVLETARAFGVAHRGVAEGDPTLGVGTYEVTLWELAGAFAGLANLGWWCPPRLVRLVTGPDGQVLYRADRSKPCRQVADPSHVEVVRDAMEQVTRYGTARQVGVAGTVAGKTGTTDSFADAWFIGATPRFTLGVWVGRRDSRTPLPPLFGVRQVYGGTIPARLWLEAAGPKVSGSWVPVNTGPPVLLGPHCVRKEC